MHWLMRNKLRRLAESSRYETKASRAVLVDLDPAFGPLVDAADAALKALSEHARTILASTKEA